MCGCISLEPVEMAKGARVLHAHVKLVVYDLAMHDKINKYCQL